MTCHKSKCIKLSITAVKEKSITLSKSFSQIIESIKLPGSVFSEGSHFIFPHDSKMFVLCDVKQYYHGNGRYVVVFDLENGSLDFIDKEVRRYCPFKNKLVALEQNPKSPGKKFNELCPSSSCEWVKSPIEDFPAVVRYPDVLVHSSHGQLFIISGKFLHVYAFELKQWFKFELEITDGTIEPSLFTTYAILDEKLFICYADKAKLYCVDTREITNGIITQSHPGMYTLLLTLMLYPVNYIIMHENYLVALYINDQDKYNCFIERAWYYSTCCDHWHNITSFDPYIDGQWFTTEDGKAAIAKLSASWYVLYGWDISVKTYQVQLSEE